ncbi:MAG: STAS domain-containing protein [Rhodospirillaceae bacterium]
MSVTVETVDAIQVVMIEGRLDGSNAPDVEDQLKGLITPETNRVVIDMSTLTYISSAGLRLVLMMAKQIKPLGGKFVLCGLQPNVTEVFEISGFLSILTVVEDRDAALSAAA